jgi:hypothetical protein
VLFVYDYWLDDTQILAKSFATFEHSPSPLFSLDASALSQSANVPITGWSDTGFGQTNAFNAPLAQVTSDNDKYASFVSTSTPVTSNASALALAGQSASVVSSASAGSSWTLEVFFYPLATGVAQCALSAGNVAVYVASNGAVTIAGTGAGGGSPLAAGTANFSGWNHVYVSYDSSTYRAGLNGVTTSLGAAGNVGSFGTVLLGSDGLGAVFYGYVRDLRVESAVVYGTGSTYSAPAVALAADGSTQLLANLSGTTSWSSTRTGSIITLLAMNGYTIAS